MDERVNDLYEIGKMYLDGREGTNIDAVRSAIALSLLEKIYRSGSLPNLFINSSAKVNTQKVLENYIELMGGEALLEDISECIKKFIKGTKDPDSEIYGGRITVYNGTFYNSGLVNGADFDCVFQYDNTLILTEIKTMIKPLGIEHIRQVIGYSLLYDEKKDNFVFSAIGFYHSRSGSFRFLPINIILEKCFHKLESIQEARKEFVRSIR